MSDGVATNKCRPNEGLVVWLNTNHTEFEPGRVTKDHPMASFLKNGCPETLKTSYFCIDIVGVEVEMDPRVVTNLLDEQ